jgi:hypothetical protein
MQIQTEIHKIYAVLTEFFNKPLCNYPIAFLAVRDSAGRTVFMSAFCSRKSTAAVIKLVERAETEYAVKIACLGIMTRKIFTRDVAHK